jgi:hypothetical protein
LLPEGKIIPLRGSREKRELNLVDRVNVWSRLCNNDHAAGESIGWVMGRLPTPQDATNVNLLKQGLLWEFNKSLSTYKCREWFSSDATSGLQWCMIGTIKANAVVQPVV